jgi:hypothetical protein
MPGRMALEWCWNGPGTALEWARNELEWASNVLERRWNGAGTVLERCWNGGELCAGLRKAQPGSDYSHTYLSAAAGEDSAAAIAHWEGKGRGTGEGSVGE